ncbi:DedA family protein [Bacillus sp. MUM 13]|uniref:DedA family protein n=1 Tax=Bacillus sp. MUM 13 TaxID=1678001 RepID=UPI0008F5BC5B|nr:DedA family protein [Bacillus sp. MUM 13]OIK08330.1 alkaline phosphatase [Bacillus sp. MUM 13]
MEEHLNNLIHHYGYFGIILVLIGGIIGLPIPDEVLLTYVGYNVFSGRMSYEISLVCSFFGAIGGISASYFLGLKLGLPFLKKFGPKLHITESRIALTRRLFSKLGPYLLFLGFFIPGVRHVTAYLAGINCLTFKRFSLFAFSGAALWVFTFITLGYKLGSEWKQVQMYTEKWSVIILPVFMGLILLFIFFYKRAKKDNT